MTDAKRSARERCSDRLGELSSIDAHPPPGAILVAAGDLLRRSRALSVDARLIDDALSRLEPAATAAWVAAIDVDAHIAAFTRGAAAAAEAALADSDQERGGFVDAALRDLLERDRLASAAAALGRRKQLGGRQALAEKLAAIDRVTSTRVRRLSGANEARRAELELLDPEHRAGAFWFSARGACDGIVAALAGETSPAWEAHVEGCADCAGDLRRSRGMETPPRREHLSAAELFRYELCDMTPRERARAERHADTCAECADALSALVDGEWAIADAEA